MTARREVGEREGCMARRKEGGKGEEGKKDKDKTEVHGCMYVLLALLHYTTGKV